MFKLLIVDDEEIIRHGINKSFKWQSIGITDVYEAEDGIEAKEIIEKHHPNIMITDIRMPNMDGLQLAEYCKENNISIKIIIISGYDDFSYAQKAMQFGVKNYLIKPTRIDNLVENVKTVINELAHDYKIKNQVFRSVLSDIVNKRLTNVSELQKKFQISFNESNLNLVLFKPMEEETQTWKPLLDNYLIGFGISNILSELMQNEKFEIFVDNLSNIAVLFYNQEKSFDIFETHIEQIRERIEISMDICIKIGISNSFNNLEELYDHYREALYILTDNSNEQLDEYLSEAILEAKEYINQHICEDISLNTMANIVHMSPNYFSMLFKKEMGEKFSSYVARVKIEKSMQLLKKRNKKMYEVAQQVGFENSHYFSIFFKKHTNMTVSEFQKLLCENNKKNVQ